MSRRTFIALARVASRRDPKRQEILDLPKGEAELLRPLDESEPGRRLGRELPALEPIYRWASARGYSSQAEHVLIEGVAVQFLPAHNALADEAIETAVTLDYEGVPVRVVRSEYLVALYLEPGARTLKRRERAAALRESPAVDPALLAELLRRFDLEP